MSKFFINRPIVAMVISIVMVLVGALTVLSLPVAQFPNITPPEIQVLATYVGADAQTLEQADLMPLAQYFSKKPWPNLEQPRPPDDIVGTIKRVNAGIVCTSCHLQDLKGDSITPRLAGQTQAYLHKIMIDFATGARSNNNGMTAFMKDLTVQDIAAMAAWLARK